MDDSPRAPSDPPTRPTNDPPVPTLLEVYRRQEDLCRAIALLKESVDKLPAELAARVNTAMHGFEETVTRLLANVEVCRVEEHRHGMDIAQLRSDLDAHLFRAGGGSPVNGGVSGG